MSLTRALTNAYSGLSNSAFRADVTANNIANASTPGYVRRSVISAENTTGGAGNGVRTVGVERSQDIGVSRLRRDADASVGRADILANSYINFEREIGVPGESNSLFSGYSALETSLRDLASTPESPALQNSVLVASTELSFQFNKLSSSINVMRANADLNINGAVQTVNDSLYRLQEINGDIAGREPHSASAVALEDERLSGYFAVRDSVAPGFQAEIDGLAGDLISRFSNDNLDPTKTAGDPGIFTDEGGTFDPANSVGVAGRFRLNAAIDPVQGGDVTRFRDGLGAAAAGPAGRSDIITNMLSASFVGKGRIRHDSLSVAATARAALLGDAELQAQGVDTDFELQNLLLIEQSYAANARVIQTVGDMIDRILQL